MSPPVRPLFSKRWFPLAVGLASVLVLVLLSLAGYYGVWTWRDWQIYQAMSRECHPVWRDLHQGRIRAGQPVEDVIATAKPVRVERYGEFVLLQYQEGLHFTGVTITAKDGNLASAEAWSCAWNREFFNQLTDADRKALYSAHEAHWQAIIEQRQAAEQHASSDRGGT